MRVLATGDLHYDIARSQGSTEETARLVCSSGADVFLLLGDVAGRDLESMHRALDLFDGFPGLKLLVAGNHDLWVPRGGDSLNRYELEIPAVCREHGWHYLDDGPAYVDDVAFVGNMGWYDHSFRLEELGIPIRFYQAKIAPGAAARLAEHRPLLDGLRDIRGSTLEITTRWMDGRNVRLPLSDEDFTGRLLAKLRAHLAEARRTADHIVVGMHHLPFKAMTLRTGKPIWDFATNYLGSERFGEVLLGEPKVRRVLCAHNHRACEIRCGDLTCTSVGSTYTAKRLVELELKLEAPRELLQAG